MRLAVLVFAFAGVGVATATGASFVACSTFHDDGSGGEEGGAPAGEAGEAPEAGVDGGAPSPNGDGGPAGSATIFCQGLDCNPENEICCLSTKDTGSPSCLPQAEAGACDRTIFTCDDNADCAHVPGTVCCGTLESEVGVVTSGCYSELNCRKVAYWVVLCDPGAGSAACPDAGNCTLPKGGAYGFCDGLHY